MVISTTTVRSHRFFGGRGTALHRARKARMGSVAAENIMRDVLLFGSTALALTLLTGCATSGPTGADVLTSAIPAKSARLVIYRSSAVGLAIQPDYLVDGKPIASSQPNGFVLCHLPVGRHQVVVSNMPLSNNFFGDGVESMTVNLRPGTVTYIAASPQMGVFTAGKITLKEVSEVQGRADTATFHQINSGCG
jgi:hypothetical protein